VHCAEVALGLGSDGHQTGDRDLVARDNDHLTRLDACQELREIGFRGMDGDGFSHQSLGFEIS
jgi:hypothetical protein